MGWFKNANNEVHGDEYDLLKYVRAFGVSPDERYLSDAGTVEHSGHSLLAKLKRHKHDVRGYPSDIDYDELEWRRHKPAPVA